jgi:hypothetical protein
MAQLDMSCSWNRYYSIVKGTKNLCTSLIRVSHTADRSSIQVKFTLISKYESSAEAVYKKLASKFEMQSG